MKEPPPNQKCECLCLAYAKAYAESHPLECLEMLAKRYQVACIDGKFHLDVIYWPNGETTYGDGHVDFETEDGMTREEAAKLVEGGAR